MIPAAPYVYAAPDRSGRATKRAPDRLAGWIRWSMRLRPGVVWARLSIPAVCKRLGISERTGWRAKAYLMAHQGHYGFRFVTLRSRGVWVVLVALESRLLYDRLPLFDTAGGQSRLVRDWIRGEELARPCTVTDKRDYIRRNISRGDHIPSGAPWGGSSFGGGGKPPADALPPAYPPTRPGYYHALARRLQSEHWDNCKVNYLHRAAVGYVRRCLSAGVRPAAIIGAYSAALHECHAMATDRGLNSGDPRLHYGPGSTLRRAYLMLGFEPVDTDKGLVYYMVRHILL